MIPRAALVLALVSLGVASGCPGLADERCNVDDDCKRSSACIDGFCTAEDGSEGAAAEGEGEAGEGEAGEGEGEGDAGEGEGDAGEGEGDAGEGEGDAGEGEGAHGQAPTVTSSPDVVRVRADESAVVATCTDLDGDACTVHAGAFALGTFSDKGNELVFSATVVGGPSLVSVDASDGFGNKSGPSSVSIEVLPADWLDVTLTNRVRFDIREVSAVSGVVNGLVASVHLQNASGVDVVAAARSMVVFTDSTGSVVPGELDHDDGSLFYWVRLDNVDARTSAGDFLYLYAGGTAPLTVPAPTDVWRDYVAVYHFETLADASGHHGDLALRGDAGLVGGHLVLDGSGDGAIIGDEVNDISGAPGCTLSISIKGQPADSEIVSYSSPTLGASRAGVGVGTNGTGATYGRSSDSDAALTVADGATILDNTVITQLDGVMDMNADVMVLFVNGLVDGTTNLSSTAAFASSPSPRATIGINEDLQGFEYTGVVDEVRVAPIVRSDDFLAVDAASRAGTLTTEGPVEN